MTAHPQDDRAAALFQARYRSLVAYFTHRGWELDAARDLARDCFVRVIPHLHRVQPGAEVTYLWQTAHGVAANAIRSRHAAKRAAHHVPLDSPEMDGTFQVADPAPSPEDEVIALEETRRRRHFLAQAITALPPGQRQAVQLLLGGLSYKEMAAILHMSVDGVKGRLRIARHHLRRHLAAAGYEVAWPAALEEDENDDPQG